MFMYQVLMPTYLSMYIYIYLYIYLSICLEQAGKAEEGYRGQGRPGQDAGGPGPVQPPDGAGGR